MNQYFIRQTALSEIGETGQQKLKNAKVLVVGAGGLGCPVMQYLAAAGTGTLGIIDHDVVTASNLHRQVLFGVADEGMSKAGCAAEKLKKMYPWTKAVAIQNKLQSSNAGELIREYDVIADCSDNFETRYLVNDVCVSENKPFVSASIYRFSGQLSVFNFNNGPTFRCIFPSPPNEGDDCSTAGVMGAQAGIIGSLQALEIIKVITGSGETLSGKLLIHDGLKGSFQTISFSRNESLWNEYQAEPVFENNETETGELLIDVRESWEHEEDNRGGINIPLSELPNHLERLKSARTLVLYCNEGRRSRLAAQLLREHGIHHIRDIS